MKELKEALVVPYIGTWIETNSRPLPSTQTCVVPYIGTWIETSMCTMVLLMSAVVPYIGTWIETNSYNNNIISTGSYLI